jgi:Ni/Fe-hydrogenase 1 B-type cytochrome subunit
MSTAAIYLGEEKVRVYVWDAVVRHCHWVIGVSLLGLSATGFFIGRPLNNGPGPASAYFTMGWMRFIHYSFAIFFTLAVLSRLIWMFIGPPAARWSEFVPVAAHRRRGIFRVLLFYLFLVPRPPPATGHNPLAGATYFWVFVCYLVNIVTGFALYSASAAAGSPMRAFRFLGPWLGGLQTARTVHHVVMWLLLAFLAHHVFSVLLAAQVEQNGEVDAVVSGNKFLTREDLAEEAAERNRP